MKPEDSNKAKTPGSQPSDSSIAPKTYGESSGGGGTPQLPGHVAMSPGKPQFIPLAGSTRNALPEARLVGPVGENEMVELTLYVRPKQTVQNLPSPELFGEIPPQQRAYATTADIDNLFGADPADLDRVEAYARSKGLEVSNKSVALRRIELRGPASAATDAFPAKIGEYEHPTARFRGRTGPVYIPAEFDGVIDSIFGFDNRTVGHAKLRYAGPTISRNVAQPHAYYPPQVAQLYNFPPQFDGAGQSIGILVFNGKVANTGIVAPGGYNASALQNYFSNILGMKMPSISDVIVHGPGNSPNSSDPQDVSGEVMLDIQTASSCAPGAKLVMYFTEFTERGWVDAIMSAVHDDVNSPSVLSISYGNPEDAGDRSLWTESAIRLVSHAFQVAVYKGITICCAAGDQGSSDLGQQLNDGLSHVDFPASSPYALGCGGTRLESRNGIITQEKVWNNNPDSATGGGVSTLFPKPQYQRYVTVPRSNNPGHRSGRVVPDVSGLADPETGVLIMNVNGQPERYPVGGTSLTAPLWAALVARINQAIGTRSGFLNPILYKYMASGVLRDITVGDNGAYSAAPGYDAVTGLGSPDGVRLLAALQNLGSHPAAAGLTVGHIEAPSGSVEDRLARIEAGILALGQRQEILGRMLCQAGRMMNIPCR